MIRITALCSLLAFFGLACQEHAEPALTPGQKKKVAANLLKEAPKPKHVINALIEDQVKLIGYDLDKTTVKPGESFTITYYFEGLHATPDNNSMFVHFQGAKNVAKAWQNLDHHPVEGLFPLRQLKKGMYLRDTQTVKVRPDFVGSSAKIYWGLFRGDYRLKIRNSKDVKHDGDNRVIVAELKIKGGAKAKPAKKAALPLATAVRLGASDTIAVDGKMDEAIWAKARWTKWWTTPDGKGGAAPRTRARFAWDDTNLYVGVFSEDSDVWSTFKDRDSDTWKQEVIEIFIDADGDKKDYLELQVTPTNVIFDAKFAKHRSDLAKARAWNMAGLKTAVTVDGTVNKREDTDKSWTLEVAIPIAQVPGAKNPPKHGNTWRVNLFRWDFPKAGRQKPAAWSPPVVGDFHALNKFGRLRLVDPSKARVLPKGLPDLKGPKTLKLDPAKLRELKRQAGKGAVVAPASGKGK